MPTNHITQRSALSARLLELALEANDIADLLLAEELDPMEINIYIGGPAFLLSFVLDNLDATLDLFSLTPLPEQPVQLEMARIIASVMPPERRAKYLRAKAVASSAPASIASGSER